MQLKTILNQVQKHRCFIYGAVSLSEKDKAIEIDIRPRANSRLVLQRPINLTDKQEVRLAELLQYNLRTVRSYLLKEDFQFFWGYISPHWAGRFLDRWCTRVMRSRIEPMKKVAKTLRRHRMLILNGFRAKGTISAAAVEGFNNKAILTTRKAFGFRTFKAVEVALFHTLGDLPEPTGTHRFC